MKNKIFVVAISLVIIMSCNNRINNSTTNLANANALVNNKDDSAGDWISLFDGKTTKGWHSYGKKEANDRWKIVDGAIYLDNKAISSGDLVSDGEYKNFYLKLEWKIAQGGNSGIIFYVHEDTARYKNTYLTGPEMQVLDNDGHADGKIIKHRAGDLYDLISCSKETVKPVGEWNEVEIISKDGELKLFMNETDVVTTSLWNDNWKKMVLGSKFKSMPGFGIYKKGNIALQDHGDMVWYRNIKIKKL